MTPPSARPRALLLAPVVPWCRETGSSLIIADMIQGLVESELADVLPVFLRDSPVRYTAHPPAGLDEVRLGVSLLPRWQSTLRALVTGRSPMRLRFDTRGLASAISDEVARRAFAPTVVHVEHLPLVDIGLAIGSRLDIPVVFRSHNFEAQLLDRRLRVRGPIATAIRRRAVADEADAIARCDLTLAISEEDQLSLAAIAPRARVDCMPCSLLTSRYAAWDAVARRGRPTIAFVGGLDWAPNDVGLRWFVDRVLPIIVASRPDADVVVLARGARERTWLTENPAITLVDDATDPRDLFASSWLSIAPLLQGGGVRIKIPESLALGCPVVATRIGAEGHTLADVWREDAPDAFARACLQLLDPARQPPSRGAMRARVAERHGADRHAARLAAWWSELG